MNKNTYGAQDQMRKLKYVFFICIGCFKFSTFLFAHRRNKAGSSDYGYCHLYAPGELKRNLRACGLEVLRFSSEWHGILTLPSFLPGPMKNLLFPLVYFGERIGCLARKPG